MSEAEACARLDSEHGMPILADDVMVVMSPRLVFGVPAAGPLAPN